MPLACWAAFAFCVGVVFLIASKPSGLLILAEKAYFFVIAAIAGIFYCVAMKQRVVLFLYPGIVPLNVSGPLEVFAAARAGRIAGVCSCAFTLVGHCRLATFLTV